MEREALKLALDVLIEMSPSGPTGSDIWQKQMSAITTIAKALAQPAQEPVADRLERLLWEYIDLQAAHPEHKPNPKTWPHLMTYAPLPVQEPSNLLEARKIAAEYKTPDSQIDSGNLYFALRKCLEHIDVQPAQEPEMLTIVYQSGYHDGKQAALAGREWNFCERCGKRTADLTIIHTCTPPQEGT